MMRTTPPDGRYSSYIQSPPTGDSLKSVSPTARGSSNNRGRLYGRGSPASSSPPLSSYFRKLEFSVNSWAASHNSGARARKIAGRSSSATSSSSVPDARSFVAAASSAATAPPVSGTAATQTAGFLRRYKAGDSASTASKSPAKHVERPSSHSVSSQRDPQAPNIDRGRRSSASLDANSRSRAHNDNVMVVVRVRPMLLKEMKRQQLSVVEVSPPNVLKITRLADRSNPYLKSGKGARYDYSFDEAFGPECSQQEVWQKTAAPLVDTVMDGTNATIFVYGATGTGKTYTMMGNDKTAGMIDTATQGEDRPASSSNQPQPGIVSLTLRNLFNRIRESTDASARNAKFSWTVVVSYLEIYNEHIRDLLSPSSRPLSLRENPALGYVHIASLTEAAVSTEAEIMELLRAGNCRRRVEPTSANRVSSRSHAILQVQVTCFQESAGGKSAKARDQYSSGGFNRFAFGPRGTPIKAAMLSMIDLAGSERAATTHNRGLRLKEGANINRSLLALANCINALAVNGSRARARQKRTARAAPRRVKYRDSKLTHILKNSLEGNCRVVMIANLSPAHSYFEESLNTLKYASRARNIRIQPVAQVVDELPPQPHAEYLRSHGGEYDALDSDDGDDLSTDSGGGTQQRGKKQDRGRGKRGAPLRERKTRRDGKTSNQHIRNDRRRATQAAELASVAAVREEAEAEIARVKQHYAAKHQSLQKEVAERLARKEAEKEAEREKWQPQVAALRQRIVELEAENQKLRRSDGSTDGRPLSGRSTATKSPSPARAEERARSSRNRHAGRDTSWIKPPPYSRHTPPGTRNKNTRHSSGTTARARVEKGPTPRQTSAGAATRVSSTMSTKNLPRTVRRKKQGPQGRTATCPQSAVSPVVKTSPDTGSRRATQFSPPPSTPDAQFQSPPRISFNFRKLAAVGNSKKTPSPQQRSSAGQAATASSFFDANFDSFRKKLGQTR